MEAFPFGGLMGTLVLLLLLAFLAFQVSSGISSGGENGSPMTRAPLIETVSVLVIGVLTSAFVGFGIQAFYPSPEHPEPSFEPPPEQSEPSSEPPPESGGKVEFKGGISEEEEEFQERLKSYEEEVSRYNRIAASIAVGIAVLILAAVLLLRRFGIPIFRDGVALGGVLTLFYGLVLALQAEGDVFKFLMVAATLLVVLVAVYLRFRPGRREV